MHHIAFCARDIARVQTALEERGVKFIAAQKQDGIKDFKFNFAIPGIAGINVELIEDPDTVWPE